MEECADRVDRANHRVNVEDMHHQPAAKREFGPGGQRELGERRRLGVGGRLGTPRVEHVTEHLDGALRPADRANMGSSDLQIAWQIGLQV